MDLSRKGQRQAVQVTNCLKMYAKIHIQAIFRMIIKTHFLFQQSPTVLLWVFLVVSLPVQAELIAHPEEVLREQFGAEIEFTHKNNLLTKDKKNQIEKLAEIKLDSNLFSFYTIQKKQKQLGICYLDTQKVRTKNALIMVCIDSTGNVKHVEIVAFFEPKQYIPNKEWLKQFSGSSSLESAMLKKNVTALTGATLSAQAVNKSVSIAKAIWKLNSSQTIPSRDNK